MNSQPLGTSHVASVADPKGKELVMFIAEKGLRTPLSIRRSRLYSIKQRIGCTCRKPFCCYFWAAA